MKIHGSTEAALNSFEAKKVLNLQAKSLVDHRDPDGNLEIDFYREAVILPRVRR